MANRLYPADVIASLDRLLTHKERNDDREQAKSLQMMQMQFNNDAREDRQEFEMDKMKTAIELNLNAQYPGATFDRETNTFDYSKVNWGETKDAMVATSATITEELRLAGLDFEGTDDEKSTRLGVYNRAKLQGTTMMQPSVSPSVSMQLGDRTPGMYTEHDIIDYEGWFDGSGGVNSPIALNDLVESGIIDDNILTRNNLGMYTGGTSDVEVEKTSELIKVAFAGLKAGSKANASYKSTQAFEMQTEADRAKNMQFASDLTNNAAVTQTIQTFDSVKRGIGGTILSVAVDPNSNQQTALWHGQRVALSDIYDDIKRTKGPFKDEAEKSHFISFMKSVFSIGADGSNIETVLSTIKTNTRFLDILGSQQFNPALATSLSNAVDKWSDIVKISKLAGDFIEEPIDVGQISDFRGYLQNSGLLYGFQKLRVMQAGNDPKAEEYYKEIEALTMKQYDMIRKTGDKKMLTDFQRWLDLEDATSGLFIDSLKKTGGI